jgi:hypothetical protein
MYELSMTAVEKFEDVQSYGSCEGGEQRSVMWAWRGRWQTNCDESGSWS